MTDSDVNHLDPILLKIYREWLIECYSVPLATKAIVTWRSSVDQNLAKAKHLSNAAAGQSPHNYVDAQGNPASRAFDFAIFDDDGKYITDGTDPRYRQAGEIGKKMGLVYGGDWQKPDWDHLELANWKTS